MIWISKKKYAELIDRIESLETFKKRANAELYDQIRESTSFFSRDTHVATIAGKVSAILEHLKLSVDYKYPTAGKLTVKKTGTK